MYNPIKFIKKIDLLTIKLLASFVTLKMFNALYENLYEPIIDSTFDIETNKKYYVKIGKYYVQISKIIHELLKWIILIFILMFFYNSIKKLNKM